LRGGDVDVRVCEGPVATPKSSWKTEPDRYQRTGQVTDAARGLRNGYAAVTVKTTTVR